MTAHRDRRMALAAGILVVAGVRCKSRAAVNYTMYPIRPMHRLPYLSLWRFRRVPYFSRRNLFPQTEHWITYRAADLGAVRRRGFVPVGRIPPNPERGPPRPSK